MPESRDGAIDALRTAVTLLVVFHHSILAYATFSHFDRLHYTWSTAPVVDDRRWAGFDLLILFNDGWFMAAMFAVSGLFVLPGLRRYGPLAYLRRRVLRLGVPFVVAAGLLMPLAYYPSYQLTGATDGYWSFWVRSIADGPWSAGPAWFLWVLLVFDAAAAGLVWLFGFPRGPVRPGPLLAVVMVLAMAGTILPLTAYDKGYWFTAGPFAIQADRIALYAASFAAGTLAGPHHAHWRVRGRPLTCLIAFCGLIALEFSRRSLPGDVWIVGYGVVLVVFCATTGLSALAAARRFRGWWLRTLQQVGPDAFWIYVVHYVPMVWLQYALLAAPIPSPVKAAVVFGLTLAVSWAAAACIRLALGRVRHQRMPSTSIIS